MLGMRSIAAAAVMCCLALGCASETPDNAATRLHDTLVEGNQKFDDWINDGIVVTHEMQREVMDPINEATVAYAIEIETMSDDLEYGESNRDVFIAIAREFMKLADTLGLAVSDSYADASEECDCTDSGSCGTPTPTPALLQDEAAAPINGEVGYKSTCIGLANAAYVGCVALCWKKCLLSAKKRAICIAACTALLTTATTACGNLEEPWSN